MIFAGSSGGKKRRCRPGPPNRTARNSHAPSPTWFARMTSFPAKIYAAANALRSPECSRWFSCKARPGSVAERSQERRIRLPAQAFFERPHLGSPLQKTPKTLPFSPEEFAENAAGNRFRRDAGEGLQTPPQIGASPGPQPVASRGRPEETQGIEDHRSTVWSRLEPGPGVFGTAGYMCFRMQIVRSSWKL